MQERYTDERRLSFDQKAEQYDAIRPGYPEAVVDDVLARTGAATIVEIGAGTGKATVLFARKECEVTAIEPGPKLAAVLRRNVAAFPAVTVAETTFEAWPASPCDLVVAAQSLHWVDPGARFRKASRVAPALAVIYNEKDDFEPALRDELDAAYARSFPGADPEAVRGAVAKKRAEYVAQINASRCYGDVEVELYPWTASYTSAEYISLLDTYSDHAILPDERRLPLYADIAAAIDRRGGITIPYVTMLFLAQRR